MNLNRVDLNLLVVFETIYREGNLTRAAETLHVTQPAISSALSRLRDTCDDQLFVRSGRGVAPTPVAQRMINSVRKGLRHLRDSLDHNYEFLPEHSDQVFTISAGDFVATAVLPKLMGHIATLAPSVRVLCRQVDRTEIATALETGEIDIAIDVPDLTSPSLNKMKLWSADHVCAMRQGHPAMRKRLDLERFLSLEHISVSNRPKGATGIEMALSRQGMRIVPKMRVQFYLSALEVIKATDLVLVAPRILVQSSEFVTKELPFDQPEISTWLYWHRNADADPANHWLREGVLGLFPN